MTSTQLEPELAHIDALILKLKNAGVGELLVEHLQTAHAYLHGAMPMECAHNLELARDRADGLASKSLQDEVKQAIHDLLQALHSSHPAKGGSHPPVVADPPRVTAKGIAEFFHGEDVSFGIFYPKKHVVAVFPSYEQAQAAYKVLSAGGFRMWEIIAVSGPEVQRFLEQIRMNRTLWDELVKEVSRFLDTEINLVEHYGQWARQGAGFLVVRAVDHNAAERVAAILSPLKPFAMHWFMSAYIQHLTEGN
jgi:hypothetical protein